MVKLNAPLALKMFVERRVQLTTGSVRFVVPSSQNVPPGTPLVALKKKLPVV